MHCRTETISSNEMHTDKKLIVKIEWHGQCYFQQNRRNYTRIVFILFKLIIKYTLFTTIKITACKNLSNVTEILISNKPNVKHVLFYCDTKLCNWWKYFFLKKANYNTRKQNKWGGEKYMVNQPYAYLSVKLLSFGVICPLNFINSLTIRPAYWGKKRRSQWIQAISCNIAHIQLFS